MFPFLAQTDPDLIRPFWSLDFDDIASLLLAGSAVIAIFVTRRTRSKVTEEHIDADVLVQFKEILERVSELERELASTRELLERTQELLEKAIAELAEMKKLEEYLQAKLHEKETEIAELRKTENRHISQIRSLKGELGKNRARLSYLETVCRRAGLDGELEDNNG
jgi:chromosome segregation ATPase